MKRASAQVAVVLVVLLAWANVGMAGQRDRLRGKVRNLTERVAALEQRTSYLQLPQGNYRGPILGGQVYADCPDGAVAVWQRGEGSWAVLSC